MPRRTPDELQRLMVTLDDVCAQARRLQEQIKATMAAAARRDYPHRTDPIERRKARRKSDG